MMASGVAEENKVEIVLLISNVIQVRKKWNI